MFDEYTDEDILKTAESCEPLLMKIKTNQWKPSQEYFWSSRSLFYGHVLRGLSALEKTW